MKLIGQTIIVTLGFGLGVIAPQIQFSSSIKNTNVISNERKNSETGTKIEDYWIQTSLEKSHLEKYVNNITCQKNKKTFLACVNSIHFALQKTNYRLNLDGSISTVSKNEKKVDNYTEKENLTPFLNIFSDGLNVSFNFKQIWNQVLAINPKSMTKNLIASGINGYLSVAADPHTYISPTDFFRNVSSNNERSKYFLGLSFEKRENKIFIKKVFKNSDADLSGLKNDDEVLSINGQQLHGLNLNEVSELLKNKDQKIFPLIVKRHESTFVKKLTRSYRILSQVQSEVLDNGQKIGYIQLSKFAYNICENVRSEIQKMQPATLVGLVLDLRDNPGGLLTEASCLAGLFIGEGKKIFSIQYLNQKQQEVSLTTSEQVYFGPLAILTNNSSASASELIAGALQEYKRATIVGERTFGKGTFQEIEGWNNSNEISLFQTKGFYLLPSGKSTQAQGVTPDILVAGDSLPRNEFSNYMFPLEIEKSLQKIHSNQELTNSMGRAHHCSQYNEHHLSEDKFISTAQKILSCEFNLSASSDQDIKNINL